MSYSFRSDGNWKGQGRWEEADSLDALTKRREGSKRGDGICLISDHF
jgi:hypothetical protein